MKPKLYHHEDLVKVLSENIFNGPFRYSKDLEAKVESLKEILTYLEENKSYNFSDFIYPLIGLFEYHYFPTLEFNTDENKITWGLCLGLIEKALKQIEPSNYKTLINNSIEDLKSDDITIRWNAANILEKIGDVNTIEPLIEKIYEQINLSNPAKKDFAFVRYIVLALGQIGRRMSLIQDFDLNKEKLEINEEIILSKTDLPKSDDINNSLDKIVHTFFDLLTNKEIPFQINEQPLLRDIATSIDSIIEINPSCNMDKLIDPLIYVIDHYIFNDVLEQVSIEAFVDILISKTPKESIDIIKDAKFSDGIQDEILERLREFELEIEKEFGIDYEVQDLIETE